MPEQLSLLDVIEAETAKSEALERVEANADPSWKKQAMTIVKQLASSRSEFTTDDVWEALFQADVDMPHEPRALGAMMRNCAHEGRIVATDRYVPSARIACHRRPVRVWRSLCLTT